MFSTMRISTFLFRSVRLAAFCAFVVGASGPLAAEERTYGAVTLTGLAKKSWAYNPRGESATMVCNVSGPDGFLAIRSGPGTDYPVERRLKRLAIVVVDTSRVRGAWVAVTDAYRTHSETGRALASSKPLTVLGWAHSNYLCDFID
ncbi:MAG: SH3 domain-containing protein [Neomegalonema sp.]|nr:SH3 domain-containing protein [Neomegalonema sp.]